MAMRGVVGLDLGEEARQLARPAEAPTGLRNVLVAIDASEGARNAAAFGSRLVLDFGSRLHLVHAVEPGSHEPLDASAVASVFDFVRRELATRRPARRRGVPEAAAAAVETVRRGHVARELVALAGQISADLIVSGTRHAPGRRRLAAESVAGELVRRAPCPVLVVHEQSVLPRTGVRLFQMPLAAIDDGDASRAALRSAVLLAAGARVDAVHVIEFEKAKARRSALDVLHEHARAIEAARTRLQHQLSVMEVSPPQARAVVAVGPSSEALVHFAVGGGYDLVACGTHARKTMPFESLGSVAEALLDALSCPVLALREARSKSGAKTASR